MLGDTTTTMMWIAGISPARLFEAIIASTVALFIFGIPAAIQQHKHSPILRGAHAHTHVDWTRVGIVGLILVLAIGTNVTVNMKFTEQADHFPFIGMTVLVGILLEALACATPHLGRYAGQFLGSDHLVMAHGERTWSRAHGRAGTSRREIGFLRSSSVEYKLTALLSSPD